MPWFEVHSENYFADGGPALAALDRIRADYPLSLHGVGLSLGSADPLDRAHLAKLEAARRARRARASSPSTCAGAASAAATSTTCCRCPTPRRRSRTSARASTRSRTYSAASSLVENVSSYYAFPESTIPECEFVAAVAARTGCRLLRRRQQHLRERAQPRHRRRSRTSTRCRATRSRRSTSPASTTSGPMRHRHARRAGRAGGVDALSRARSRASDRVPTLIEWDTDIPAFAVLAARSGDRAGRSSRRAMPSLRDLQRAVRRGARRAIAAPTRDARVARLPQRGARQLSQRARRDVPRGRANSTGTPFFDAAVDAFVARAPVRRAATSTSTAARSATFSRRYPHARDLPYLPDVARLEWALDEAHRAADGDGVAGAHARGARARPPERRRRAALRARSVVPPAALAVPGAAHLAGAPGRPCGRRARAVRRGHRLRRSCTRDATRRRRRSGSPPASSRGSPRSRAGADLATALDAALAADATFDLGTALRARIADGDAAAHRATPSDRNRARRRPIAHPFTRSMRMSTSSTVPAGRARGRAYAAAARFDRPAAAAVRARDPALRRARVPASRGSTKIEDWNLTVALFENEYHVPLLSPPVAALLGTAAELALPVLLVARTRHARRGARAVRVQHRRRDLLSRPERRGPQGPRAVGRAAAGARRVRSRPASRSTAR